MSKFISRKFIVTLIGVFSGILTIQQGEITAGATLIGTALFGYLIAEGYIDAQSAKSANSDVAYILEVISKITPNKVDDRLAKALDNMNDRITQSADLNVDKIKTLIDETDDKSRNL